MSIERHRMYIFILVACIVLTFIPFSGISDTQISQMLAITLTVYALARSLNAIISVVQGTEMSIEPMGVGVTLTPGEILDPLNDLIEQFSSVLLLASASLGMQKIILQFGDLAFLRILLLGLSLISLFIVWRKRATETNRKKLVKLVVLLTLLRLIVPSLAFVSYQAQNWLSSEREYAVEVLQTTREQVDEMTTKHNQSQPSWIQGLKNQLDLDKRMDAIELRAEQGVSAVVSLLAEFMLIMVMLPLLFLYLSMKMISRIRPLD